MRRGAIVLATLAALAGGGSLIVSSGGAQLPGPPTGTLELVGLDRESDFDAVDNPPRQGERRLPSAGDIFIIQQKLRDTANNRVGEVRAVFHALGGRRFDAEAVGTFKLAQGQITVQGPVDERSRTDHSDTLTITGGTGAYEGASGVMTTRETRRETRFLFDFAP